MTKVNVRRPEAKYEWAVAAVDAIIADLSDRSGLDDTWDGIDEDIQLEIKNKWIALLIDSAFPPGGDS